MNKNYANRGLNSPQMRKAFMAKASPLAIAVLLGGMASPAFAQDASGAAEPQAAAVADDQKPAEDATEGAPITVTGTRVARDGYDAPTPTTVLGTEMLETRAPATLIDALALLPASRNSATNTTGNVSAQGTGGLSLANLRGLGPNRTLVLFNSQRVVSTAADSTINVSLFPQSLIEKVDVVTGGASAAYGSGAVAGVVNLAVNTKFKGLRGNVEAGISSHGDNATRRVSLGWGGYLGERIHVVLGGEYFETDGVPARSRDFSLNADRALGNPAFTATNGLPPRLLRPNGYMRNGSFNGIILSGPLAGNEILANGTLRAWDYCGFTSGIYMACPGRRADAGYIEYNSPLAAENKRDSEYGRIDFEVSPTVTLFADFLHGHDKSRQFSVAYTTDLYGALTIQPTNAFLPASVTSQITQPFTLGVFLQALGPLVIGRETEVFRGSGGIKADLGASWKLDAYVANGKSTLDGLIGNQARNTQFLRALDSVRVNGTAVCRINAVTVVDAACIPINPFGNVAVNNSYIYGDATQRTVSRQTAAGINIAGEPFSTWDGPVSTAFGAEYRREEVSVASDALSAVRGWRVSNWGPSYSGSVNVKEVYGEAVVPLASNTTLLQKLEVNAAARYTDYSTSGSVTTWKLGANYVPVEGLRFRATRSRDIRAPSLAELFSTGAQQNQQVTDPRNGNVQVGIPGFNGIGNANLVPEKADTTTFGVVFEPKFFPGFQISADYYHIKLRDAIGTLTSQEIVTRCAAGVTSLCSLITRTNGDGSATGALVSLNNPNLNLQTLSTKGVDFEASYRIPVAGGTLSLHALANYLDSFKLNDTRATVDRAGDLTVGLAKWNFDLSAGYDVGNTGVLISATRIGSGLFSTNPTTLVDIGTISGVWYADLALQQRITSGSTEFTLYGNVKNLFDQSPPFGFSNTGGNYDRIGRRFVVGVRVAM